MISEHRGDGWMEQKWSSLLKHVRSFFFFISLNKKRVSRWGARQKTARFQAKNNKTPGSSTSTLKELYLEANQFSGASEGNKLILEEKTDWLQILKKYFSFDWTKFSNHWRAKRIPHTSTRCRQLPSYEGPLQRSVAAQIKSNRFTFFQFTNGVKALWLLIFLLASVKKIFFIYISNHFL